MTRASLTLRVVLVAACLVAVRVPLVRGVRNLATTRGAVGVYARLIASSNAQDLASVRMLCSSRFLDAHPLVLARGGGVVGFPRQIHPNYRVWVEGSEVWFCSGNRVGAVVRFVSEGGSWKFAGPVGILRPDGRVEPMALDPSTAPEKL